jgi:hypothetical protein
MIANIDDNVGRLRQLLEDEGIAKDTIFIFMTDNGSTGAPGGHSFNAGMRAKKGSHYDGGHRVPFFMHWPGGGFDKSQPIDRLTAHLDILPTLTSLIGLDHKSELPLDGQDISWMFRGEDRPYSRTLFIDTQRILQPRKWRNSCVATEKWRLINGEELYAIKEDPGQQENVAADHPEVVSELRRRYEAYWKSLQPQFTFIPWIPIGAKQSPNQRLMSHDWFLDGNPAAWHQNNARNRSVASGSWHVDVRQNGIYELKLMQVPEEAGEPMRNVVRSELWIGADRYSLPVTQGALSVVYNVRLSKGRKKLQGWLLGNDGKNRGPYYLDVNLIRAD